MTIEEAIREHCNIQFNQKTGEEEVLSSLSAVCIAVEEFAKQNLREELIKFQEFLDGHDDPLYVDEYLKLK